MARNGSGAFKKFLNVIGLVDEPQEYDDYEGRYSNGRAPVQPRPSTYVPRQQNSRTADTRRRTVVPDDRQASRYSANSPRQSYNNINEGYTVRRPGRELEDEFDQAMDTRRGETRRSAPEPEPARTPAPRYNAAPAQSAPVPAARGGVANMVTFSLTSLEECSDVVDALIANNIVMLILDQLDDRMIQRVVDTLSGAAFALHANIRKGSERTYIIAPRTVSMSENGYYGRRG